MRLPDFIVIGAAKSGTVSLYHYLKQHPQIYMCSRNEPNYWALDQADFAKWFQGPGDQEAIEQYYIRHRADYAALFTSALPDQLIGESSPVYLYSANAAQQIHKNIPHVRLLVILRNPVDRAYSHYQHFYRAGIEPLPDFKKAVAAEEARIAQGWGPIPMWHYVNMGFYAQQLQYYYQFFDPAQVFVCLYEDFQMDPVALSQKLFTFIGVNNTFTPDVRVQHNIGGHPRRHQLYAMMTQPNSLKLIFNQVIPPPIRHAFRDAIHGINVHKPKLDLMLRNQLKALYRDDILKLQTFINRDLSGWLI
jgi:hypothetical protein